MGSLNNLLNHPFTTSTTATASGSVPHPFDFALGGHAYFLDTAEAFDQLFRRKSIQITAEQQDTQDRPGESSLNRKDLWRRGIEDWSGGAGQIYQDRPGSTAARFRTSKGVDVWTKYQMSLLPDTAQLRASTNTNLKVISVGSYYYIADGTEVYHTNTLTSPTFTSSVIHNGEAAVNVQSITSDGYNVWAALGLNGIHTTTRGAATSTHFNDLQATLVAFLKGRLMAAKDASIYNVTASGAAPAALFTSNNSDFRWVGFAEGAPAIYIAGFSGDKSLIYRTAIKTDGTALDAPVVAGELPDGEIVQSIQGYLGGFLLIGSDLGVRFAQIADEVGNLSIGALIAHTSPVKAFEPQDRFIWYALTNYDGTSTGLGRLDLSVIDESRPAYASDLMVTGQGEVQSIATFSKKRVFAVSGLGFYKESDNKVASGTLDSGLITYGIPDSKTSGLLDVRHKALAGSHKAYLSTDEGSFTHVGTHDAAHGDADPFPTLQAHGDVFEVRAELIRSATDNTKGPTITRQTLLAKPAPRRQQEWTLPIQLFEWVERDGRDYYYDVSSEIDYLTSLAEQQTLVSFQMGNESINVFLSDFEIIHRHPEADRTGFNATFVANLTTSQ